jgi:hypothetical protein
MQHKPANDHAQKRSGQQDEHRRAGQTDEAERGEQGFA